MPTVHAWCCRSCSKCMCESYGVCAPALPPSVAGPVYPSKLVDWSLADVTSFVESLNNGSRDTCPIGCTTGSLFEGRRFAASKMSGPLLHKLLAQVSAWEVHVGKHGNASAAEKTNASAVRSAFTEGLLPPERARHAMAFFNRLQISIDAQLSSNASSPNTRRRAAEAPLERVAASWQTWDECVDYLNFLRQSVGKQNFLNPATWDAYRCAQTDAIQDGGKFPQSAHASFGQCNEAAQCEAAGMQGREEDACKHALDMYFGEGPGGGHYDIMMGDFCYMAWGLCYDCSPYGTMATHNFYACDGMSVAIGGGRIPVAVPAHS